MCIRDSCRSYLVPVFGHDLYRLVKHRNLDPRSFTFICEQEQPDKVGFRLSGNGPTYGIALDKKDKLEVSQPCTFLIEEPDGSSPVSYTHLRAHETPEHLVCRLL